MNQSSGRILGVSRFFSLLALALWIGGLALIGVAAPAVFALNRLVGPRVVAAMLERFSPVTLVCGAVLLACWFIETRHSSTPNARPRYRNSLRAQGVCTLLMLLLGSYLALVAEPRIRALQPPLQQTTLKTESVTARDGTQSINPTAVTIRAGEFASPQARAEFRKLHGLYGGLTLFVVLFGVANLALIATRSVSNNE